MEQQQGFSDSTPRAGNDRLQKLETSVLSALQLISNSQISTQKHPKVLSFILTLFKLQENLIQ